MATDLWRPPKFAFRFMEIEAAEEWTTNGNDFPKPPRDYRPKVNGFELPWYSWTPLDPNNHEVQRLQPISEHGIMRVREATSIVWCQETRTFWIAAGDWDNPQFCDNKDDYYDWGQIWFNKVSSPDVPDCQSVYRAATWGNRRQLNYPCPIGFDEYLPRNKFTGTAVGGIVHCHLVGKLSLIIALYAMCLEKLEHVIEHINRCFWPEFRPVYVPVGSDPRLKKRNKDSKCYFVQEISSYLTEASSPWPRSTCGDCDLLA